MLDPMIPLALGLHSGKGVYALLLGSGISRSSGIPTGWEIVLELIQKVAALSGKDCGDDPAAWYFKEFGKEPDYSDLLEMVAPTSTERRQILNGYFEPTLEEREQKLKVPTDAHKAIAALVADGYIRVIVTTNFDRLMERALEEADVTPVVISSPDGVRGAVPLPHSPCTIFKVHGDYLDPRLKNTPAELSKYDRATNKLLNRIFDEYGLIVCGWSAEWDVALRGAIERCPSRRYTTYWSAFRGVTGAANDLCQKRDAKIIDGMDANAFFTRLGEKVTALKDMDAAHPLSAPMAVATIKRYLPNKRDEIRVHDLVLGETRRVATQLFSEVSGDRVEYSIKQYENPLDVPVAMFATVGYWGQPSHRKLWLKCFQTLVTPIHGPFHDLAIPMDSYPAFLLLYVYGIAALAGGRPGNLAYILAKGRTKNSEGEEESLLLRLVMMLRGRALDEAVQQAGLVTRGYNVPSSRYLFQRLREPLREWVPEEKRYEDLFAKFEYLLALIVCDLLQREGDGSYRLLAGLYMSNLRLGKWFDEEIARRGENWPFLRAGLFGKSMARLMETKKAFDPLVSKKAMELRLV